MTMYEYKATILRVVDADTLDMEVDMGFHVTSRQRFRLARIDAPEMKTAEGKAAKARVETLLAEAASCVISTEKGDSFGRWIAEVVLPSGVNLSDWLLAEGLAEEYRR
jgi:micrococcal nuclease